MKKFIMLCAIAACMGALASRVVSLRPGETNRVVAGQVKCIEGVTVQASQAVKLYTIASVTEYSILYIGMDVHTTNYTVCASNYVSGVTNTVPYSAPIWGSVAWPNQVIIWISTNDVSWAVTNTWSAPKATYSVTTNVWSGTASGRYIKNAPAALYLVTGDIYMTGGGNDDHLEILIGD